MGKKKSKKPENFTPIDSPPGDTSTTSNKQTGSTKNDSTTKQSGFPIVGIGASAGGLTALKELFRSVPGDTGFAFVVVVHLAPDHESHLAELLQQHVNMPVIQVKETTQLEPNRVFVIPPNANLDSVDTHLRLSKLEQRRQERAPIDHFFRTLAKTHDGEAIGIVLTGTGSDGTLGLREIKQCGGLTIVQDPNEAEFDGMPQSAIASGSVDLILTLERIPDAAIQYARTQPKLPAATDKEELDPTTFQNLQKIFAQLRARAGRDFGRYKRSTILRRIQRRMQLNQIEELSAYVEFMRENPNEVEVLADDLLITVTSFFRDKEVFEKIEKEVIPQLFAGKGSDDEIRIWSVGCATGEEAYTLAILLLEHAAKCDMVPRIQVFASDLHDNSLKKARDGFFPGDIEADVSPARLKRFFAKENGGYRIRKEVREVVIFAPHNLFSDPPFSRLDLISCRNVLIYIQREVQHDIIDIYHYALNQDGFLLLGTSETVDGSELFRVADKKCCIYQKRNVPAPEPRLPVFPLTRTRMPGEPERSDKLGEPVNYGTLHQRMVETYAPPSALVSPDDKLVHLSEHAGRYLVHPGGEPTSSIFKLVRDELRIELRSILHAARDDGLPRRSKPILVKFNGSSSSVVIHVRPAMAPSQDGFVLVIFDEREPVASTQQPARRAEGTARSTRSKIQVRERELEAELDLTKQRLQAIIEEYETSQEEMKASNEEMQSTNEELRSTMEELETSKEELQSMNEELQTVNQENRHKVAELAQLSGDLQNLLTATQIATLFLDRDLRILRFTPKVSDLFNVRMTDRSRPITDLTHSLGYSQLDRDAKQVLRDLIPVEREVRDQAGRWYLTRVMPYRSSDDRIEGVVITFVDITARKAVEQEVLEAKEYAERIIMTLPEPLLVLTSDLRVLSGNDAFYRHFQVIDSQTIGHRIYELGNGQWNIPSLRTLLEHILPSNTQFNNYEVRHKFETLGERVMLLNARKLEHSDMILLGINDISDRHEAERQRRISEDRYRQLFESIDEGFCVVEILFNDGGAPIDFLFLEVNPAFEAQTGIRNAQGRRMTEIVPNHHDHWLETFGRVAITGEPVRFQTQADGAGRYFDIYAFRFGEPEEWRVAILFSDITRFKEAEAALQEADRRKDEFLATLAHELRNPLAPICTGLELMKLAEGEIEVLNEVHSTMVRQTRQLVTIVDDLLDVSRITCGKLELKKSWVKLEEVLQTAIEAAKPGINEAGHELIVDLPSEDISLSADPNRLAQIVSNLLNNAAKYTPSSGKIWLTAQAVDGQVVIAVRDTGIGVPAEELESVFEMFTQINRPMERGGSGLGIGLTLVKSLAEMHGGTIAVHSEGVNKGTEFTVRIPIGSETDPDLSTDPQANGEDFNAETLRILIVDDSIDAATVLSKVIERFGNRVQVAHDGRRAVEIAEEFQPHIIFMDLGMPTMNGYEAAKEIRIQKWGQHVTLVALTGWGQDEDRRRTKEAGFDHHMVKPADPGELRKFFRKITRQ